MRMFVRLEHPYNYNLLSELTGLYPKQIEEKLHEALIYLGMVDCEPHLAGQSLGQFLNADQLNLAVHTALGKTNGDLENEVRKLVVKHADLDCPLCGYPREFTTEEAHGHRYTEERCTNAYCDYFHSDEPDHPDHVDEYER